LTPRRSGFIIKRNIGRRESPEYRKEEAPMKRIIQIAIAAVVGPAAIFATVILTAVMFFNVPPRVLTSVAWSPPPSDPSRPTVIVIEMGSDESFPLLWKSVGSFVEETADVNITVLHYREVSSHIIMKHAPKAVVLTGYHQELSTYDFKEMENFFDFIRKTEVPVLGICGGHQFLSMAHGSKIIELGFEEKGFLPISPVIAEPLFINMPGKPVVFLWHKMKVEALPADFILLAKNDACIQAARHKTRPLFGVQFHPEFSSGEHHDGVALFKNFLSVAGIRARQ